MNLRTFGVCFSLFFLVAACGKSSGTPKGDNKPNPSLLSFATNQQEYPALKNQPGSSIPRQDGYYGLIRVFSRHYLEGTNRKKQESKADYVVVGTGGVILIGQKYYVITARHVILPNTQSRSIKMSDKSDPVEFDRISFVQSQILVGSLGIQPNEIIVSQDRDVAILALADQDDGLIASTYSKDRDAPVSLTSVSTIENISGMRGEVWGFPAHHDPQIERVLVSASTSRSITLNRALLGGYSGGPVFLLRERGGRKEFAGIVIRADDKANQSTVLPEASLAPFFECLKTGRHAVGVSYMKIGNEISVGNVNYRYLSYY